MSLGDDSGGLFVLTLTQTDYSNVAPPVHSLTTSQVKHHLVSLWPS